MTGQERLRRLLATERERLRSTVPSDRRTALMALTRARDAHYLAKADLSDLAQTVDVDDRLSRVGLGWNQALKLGYDDWNGVATTRSSLDDNEPAGWADDLLEASGRLAQAELIVAQSDAGFLQLQASSDRTFDAWATTNRMPTEWREHEDFAWWTAALIRRDVPTLTRLMAADSDVKQRLHAFVRDFPQPTEVYFTEPAIDDYYRQLGSLHARRMANQTTYPPHVAIGGISFALYLDLIGLTIGWLLKDLDRCGTVDGSTADSVGRRQQLVLTRDETTLVNAIAAALDIDHLVARQALDSLVLDQSNVAYHAVMPGSPAPPFLRIDEEHLLWSVVGLMTTPLLYLCRELKRRHGREYHNAAALREDVFRQDLYGLFHDNRFVKSAGTFELKREGGEARTDLDALIFDRKSGTLGIFELKAQDPFARSADERQRQRDNFYRANKQILTVWQWLQRNDATSLITRIDPRTAKTFRVQRVYHFVLGRYLAHFAAGAAPDRRAAWGTWPQVMRLVGDRPFGPADANPIGSLHLKLVNDTPLRELDDDRGVRDIPIGAARIRVYHSFSAYKLQRG
jgi:hypothetical protein